MGAWVLIGAMLAILAGAIYTAFQGWNAHGPMDTPASLDVALALGAVFTLVVGCGLMALVFYSSRKGFDEPARHERAAEGSDLAAEHQEPGDHTPPIDGPRKVKG